MGTKSSVISPPNMDTIPRRLQMWSDEQPDRELFVFYDGKNRQSYTSRQVLQLAGKFAGRLRREYGFQKGDCIANTLPESPERLFTDLGIILSGCAAMSGEIMFADGSDLLEAARKSGISGVVVSPEGNCPAWKILAQYATGDLSADITSLQCDQAPSMTSAILVTRHSQRERNPLIKSLQSEENDIFVHPDIRSEDICYIFQTSGTTGISKMVSKTHADIIETSLDVRAAIVRQSRHNWGHVVMYDHNPISWITGFPTGTLVNADTRVLLDVYETSSFKSWAEVWNIVCWEKVNFMYLTPPDLEQILENMSPRDVDAEYKVDLVDCGAQPITKLQRKRAFSIAHEALVWYGSTENCFMSLGVIQEDDNFADYYCGQRRDGLDMRVVDEQGRECGVGQVGCIHVRGRGVFKGYLKGKEDHDYETRSAFTEDGWLNINDSGFFDVDKNVYVLGRHNEIIKCGSGLLLYPGWLESRFIQHPSVCEVCVVPVSDKFLQHICAIVKPQTGCEITEDELRRFSESFFVEDKNGSWFPVPKFYLILDHFPRTATGKVHRSALRRMAEDRFGFR